VLDHQAVLKSKDIKEDALTTYKPLRLGENIGSVLKRPHHLQMMIFARKLADFVLKPFNPVGHERIVLDKL